MTAAEMEGAGAAVLVTLGCVIFAFLDRVRRMAGHGKVPDVLCQLVEAWGQRPNEDGNEEMGGSAAHLTTLANVENVGADERT